MKAKLYIGILQAFMLTGLTANAQMDYAGDYRHDDANVVVNNYYDNYDYYYSSRINRFHRSYAAFEYYAPVFTDSYWYNYQPFSWGVSIYGGGGFGIGYVNPYPVYNYGYAYSPGWYDPYYGSSYYWGYNPYLLQQLVCCTCCKYQDRIRLAKLLLSGIMVTIIITAIITMNTDQVTIAYNNYYNNNYYSSSSLIFRQLLQKNSSGQFFRKHIIPVPPGPDPHQKSRRGKLGYRKLRNTVTMAITVISNGNSGNSSGRQNPGGGNTSNGIMETAATREQWERLNNGIMEYSQNGRSYSNSSKTPDNFNSWDRSSSRSSVNSYNSGNSKSRSQYGNVESVARKSTPSSSTQTPEDSGSNWKHRQLLRKFIIGKIRKFSLQWQQCFKKQRIRKLVIQIFILFFIRKISTDDNNHRDD